jgi:hypothetical protein
MKSLAARDFEDLLQVPYTAISFLANVDKLEIAEYDTFSGRPTS